MEDVLLWRALQGVEAGFYIDVGAGDPRQDSVTLAFYERGWRGINIDPEPGNIAALRAARPRDINLELAMAAEAGQARFYRFPGTGWSTLSADVVGLHQASGHLPQEMVVETQTLAAICASHVAGDIHFLKVDVEGFEAQVIAGGDFVRFRPWIIVVESTVPDSSKLVPRVWEPSLQAARYRFAQFDGLNCYYVAEEHAERLLSSLAAPANVFDEYLSVHQIELARAADKAGIKLPGFTSPALLQQAEIRAEAAEQRAAQAEAEASQAGVLAAAEAARVLVEGRRAGEAEAKVRDAELRMLAQEIEVQLLRAEAAQSAIPGSPVDRQQVRPVADAAGAQTAAQRLFFDATLILRYGFVSAVGIVRVEHYVAEYLARDPALALRFVVFDGIGKAYRTTTAHENEILSQILFHRFRRTTTYPPEQAQPAELAAETATAGSRGCAEAADPLAAIGIKAPRRKLRVGMPLARRAILSRLWARIRLFNSLTPPELTPVLNSFVLRHLPIRPHQSAARRIGVRLMRRVLLAAARAYHRFALPTAGFTRRLIAPDPVAVSHPTVAPTSFDYAPFQPGDVLVSMANTWDYMDYDYLGRLGREMGVRLLCVVYDVVGMELPFVTPSPAHLYHRHWVEIGHASECLIAISRFSAESYDRFIAQPNQLDVPIDYALLPNFLKERAAEIGEIAVQELDGRDFIVYCSTIEVRKNHILLLNLWEELRQRVDPEKLPILVFVGKWGWSAETVRLLVERNWRLRPILRVMSETSDAELIWLYRRARFTVFPSLTEGFGLAAAESLSFGTPVIISHCPALREATEDLMPAFHPHDFTGWLQEVERLILDDAYLDTLREAAKRFRGPAYETFAAKIRDRALAPPAMPEAESMKRIEP